MKNCCLLVLLICFLPIIRAQQPDSLPEMMLDKESCEQALRFLASDDLAGRRTGSDGGERAAQYLAEAFGRFGLKPGNGDTSFFQLIPFVKVRPPEAAAITWDSVRYSLKDNLLVLKGEEHYFTAQAVFAGYGWQDDETGQDDYKGLDVKGKIVIVLSGNPGAINPFQSFKAMIRKEEIARSQGAIGIIELFRVNFPWSFIRNYFNQDREQLDRESGSEGKDSDFLVALLRETDPKPVQELESSAVFQVKVENSGVRREPFHASNVVGIVPGSDDSLRHEYLVVSAHYDHIGTGKQGGGPYSPQDSIFNGARDNAMGTVALLSAARAMSRQPAKRSLVFLACTGEEMGMVGSQFYVDHPLIPLEKTVFNINNDGAGYNVTDGFTVIGLEKTNVMPELETVADLLGWRIYGDPAPGQNLYERSDNISFAMKGIPAIDFAPGISDMNEEVYRYYHQVTDDPESIDYEYLFKFCKAFAKTVRLIANKQDTPAWMPGEAYPR